MNASTITCPKCQNPIALDEAMEKPIADRLRAQLTGEVAARESEIRKREDRLAAGSAELKKAQETIREQVEAKLAEERKRLIADQAKKAREEVAIEVRELREQLTEKTGKLADAQKVELQLRKDRRELDESKANFELEKIRLIDAEREKIREEAKKAFAESFANQLKLLKEELSAKDQRLAASQEAELELRKQQAEFEQQKKELDLQLVRKADEVRDQTRKEKDDEFRLKEAESNKKLADMNRQIDELKRKAELGSQQTQGEVLELDLEAALRRCFPFDEIKPVPKGAHGGDVLHYVRNESGQPCGTIIWESKRTKSWSDGWIAKLKDDKLAAKAQLAVLVSTVMPKDVPTFECRDNVWVTPPIFSVALTAALRMVLIETAAAQRAIEGRHDKMAIMYDYIAGPQFKGRVSAIIDVFKGMRDDLEQEKRAMSRMWAKREKQIERVLLNTAGLHGDLSGILGKSLPSIETLEFAALPDETSVVDEPSGISN